MATMGNASGNMEQIFFLQHPNCQWQLRIYSIPTVSGNHVFGASYGEVIYSSTSIATITYTKYVPSLKYLLVK